MSLDNKSDREILEELYVLVREDHKNIQKLRNRIRWQNIFGVVKWFIWIGVAVGLYTYLQPIFDNVAETYSSLRESASTITELKGKLPEWPF
jgi:hypothetical protein